MMRGSNSFIVPVVTPDETFNLCEGLKVLW
jgi:hypothetical protein